MPRCSSPGRGVWDQYTLPVNGYGPRRDGGYGGQTRRCSCRSAHPLQIGRGEVCGDLPRCWEVEHQSGWQGSDTPNFRLQLITQLHRPERVDTSFHQRRVGVNRAPSHALRQLKHRPETQTKRLPITGPCPGTSPSTDTDPFTGGGTGVGASHCGGYLIVRLCVHDGERPTYHR